MQFWERISDFDLDSARDYVMPSLLYRYYEMYRSGVICYSNWIHIRNHYLRS